MTLNINLEKNKVFYYCLVLVIASYLFNQYYAYIGVLPIDSFLIFNSGYDLLNGVIPFKDVWTIKGPFLDLVQAIFFKIFGVSWFSYSSHASIFNSIFALSTFLTLRKFNLELRFCFLYSILASLLMYPTYGTPFSDHHVSILSLLSVYCLILAIKTDENIYWFFIPILLFCAFFSKQVPAGYFLILIIFTSLIYFLFNFRFEKIIYGIAGCILILTIFFLLVFQNKISLNSILEQYFLFPLSLGDTRTEWLFPLEFKRVVLRYKLNYIALAIPAYILIRNCTKNFKDIWKNESLIILSLIGTLFIFIFHQLMTINGLFIFFCIPIFCGFSFIFAKKYFKKNKYLINFLVILSLVSTLHYQNKYISKRDTLFLRDVNLNKAINSSVLDEKLKNLKWITKHYSENPKEEISNLIEAMRLIKNDKRKKMLVTDYQFISVVLSIKDYAASRFWWGHHGYPDTKNKYFPVWKKFLIKKLKENQIEVIYTIKPLLGEKDILINILSDNCYSKSKLNEIVNIQVLKSCNDFNRY